jgi:hypothetical protein
MTEATMTTDFLATRVAKATVGRAAVLVDGRAVQLHLTVRLETPGEACVAVSSTVAFSYEPPLPDEIAVRLDDRLYDGLYDGLALIEGPLPPERLRLRIVDLRSEPPLATLLGPVDWHVVRALGDLLAELAAEGVVRAWPSLRDAVAPPQ